MKNVLHDERMEQFKRTVFEGNRMKILLVEDDKIISKAIAKGLRKNGYAVDCVYDGEEALEAYEIYDYDLMILDLNIPCIDGMEVLQKIREKDMKFRILILSARNTIEDKIKGLDSGSNDYLTKPFDFGELEARIRNLIRQTSYVQDNSLSCGELQIDSAAKRAYIKKKCVDLTPKEFAILEYLLHHQGKVVGAEELVEHIWDREADPFSNSLRYHIHSLRKKLEEASRKEYIVTKRGQGYYIAEPK